MPHPGGPATAGQGRPAAGPPRWPISRPWH